jgi:manganese/zinc/iron transport system permease protein
MKAHAEAQRRKEEILRTFAPLRLCVRFSKTAVLPIIWLLVPTMAHAARIGDLTETSITEQALRFFTFSDPSLRLALLGCILLGLNCGLLGGFVVVRRMSLVGDTLSHAVLPGIALGFLWNNTKDPLAILIGATLVGGLSMLTVSAITRTTRLKEDAAMGLVLSSFYAIGICLIGMIQRLPTGNKSGIDKFLFGQAAAMNGSDIALMAITAGITLLFVTVGYRGLLTLSFHRAFGESLGLPMGFLHHAMMLLISFAVVTAMQAVGVVLVSAMLIIPPATACLLTDRMHRVLILSAVIGIATAAFGAFLSFLGSNLPTGPFMVLAGSFVFAMAFLFSPKQGWLTRLWRQKTQQCRIERENTLKAMYHLAERHGFREEGITLLELANARREPLEQIRLQSEDLLRQKLATLTDDGSMLHFTPEGWRKACAVVRNHRLWELYLTNIMQYGADHVHDDAEKIEHVLGEDTVRQLERRLDFPQTDPHGKAIPGAREVHGQSKPRPAEPIGY